jgi:hypothetical protein
MKQFIGGFLLCGLLSQFITFAWLTCVLLAAACGFALACWLFFTLLEPNKALPKLLIDTMVKNQEYLVYLTEKIYPMAMAQITEYGDYLEFNVTAQLNNRYLLFIFRQFKKDNTVFLEGIQELKPQNVV